MPLDWRGDEEDRKRRCGRRGKKEEGRRKREGGRGKEEKGRRKREGGKGEGESLSKERIRRGWGSRKEEE